MSCFGCELRAASYVRSPKAVVAVGRCQTGPRPLLVSRIPARYGCRAADGRERNSWVALRYIRGSRARFRVGGHDRQLGSGLPARRGVRAGIRHGGIGLAGLAGVWLRRGVTASATGEQESNGQRKRADFSRERRDRDGAVVVCHRNGFLSRRYVRRDHDCKSGTRDKGRLQPAGWPSRQILT